MAPSSWKVIKYGMAAFRPQLPSSYVNMPLMGVTMASVIMPLQLSPVRHWVRRSIAAPSDSKLRWLSMLSCEKV